VHLQNQVELDPSKFLKFGLKQRLYVEPHHKCGKRIGTSLGRFWLRGREKTSAELPKPVADELWKIADDNEFILFEESEHDSGNNFS